MCLCRLNKYYTQHPYMRILKEGCCEKGARTQENACATVCARGAEWHQTFVCVFEAQTHSFKISQENHNTIVPRISFIQKAKNQRTTSTHRIYRVYYTRARIAHAIRDPGPFVVRSRSPGVKTCADIRFSVHYAECH